MIKDKNLIIMSGGALIIIMILAYMLTKTNNPMSKYLPRNPYSNPAKMAEESEMNVLLSAENNSNESGVANLKDTGGIVTVTLNLTGYTPNVVQPAHIHMGACPGVGDVKYSLTSVINGKSVTVLDVNLAQLKQQLPLAINVHKSATNITTYTSCGAL